ncbi:hypothetical protein Misp01_19910 [Microtetraspora sp. NBRC 13810]|uniref:hypothetical protein n=1 Tax=Microtetraspora sp. NBRC 13810 TaxID=3030990 RepID=UPI0024A2F867|nr:hypothetical protein [Microtetraspora sp. NBRC 13810]GLW06861.1 hypothetical protein Misp01_19910 [Microtetraspora sp. NBRC 13810]
MTATNIVLVLAAVVFVLYRQMRVRTVNAPGMRVVALAMIAIGLTSGGVIDPAHVALSVVLLAVECVAAVGFGAVRAATIRIWRDEAGVLWSQGTAWTLAGWAGSFLTRLALLGVAHVLGLVTAPTSILLFVGMTIGAQALLVARRARALPARAVRVSV